MRACDSLVASQGLDAFWVGPFEDDITELGIRAALWETEENDGGNRADLMLEEWAARGYPRMTKPFAPLAREGARVKAWKITIWCETGDDEDPAVLQEALEDAELPPEAQWQVEEVTHG